MANVSAPSASNSMSNVAQKRKQSDVSDKSKKKKVEKKQWDYEETVQLITSMEDASIRAKMDGMVHNSHVWKQIAECIQPMQRNKQDNHSGISHFEKQAKRARCTAQRSGNRVTTHAQRKPHRKGRRTKGSSSFTRACLKDPLRNLPLAEDFVVGLDLRQNFSRIHQGRLSFSSMVTFHTMSLL